ncbi:MAG: hypothetical protein D6741_04420 [Planctomycetota bacterium]|nr:MAG: hypothetical protein D6741_04420 [Planctomycetota bacterium]
MKQIFVMFACGLLVAFSTATLGCADAYHRYRDCRPGCGYCVPSPLLYDDAPSDGCHSTPAVSYLTSDSAS